MTTRQWAYQQLVEKRLLRERAPRVYRRAAKLGLLPHKRPMIVLAIETMGDSFGAPDNENYPEETAAYMEQVYYTPEEMATAEAELQAMTLNQFLAFILDAGVAPKDNATSSLLDVAFEVVGELNGG